MCSLATILYQKEQDIRIFWTVLNLYNTFMNYRSCYLLLHISTTTAFILVRLIFSVLKFFTISNFKSAFILFLMSLCQLNPIFFFQINNEEMP